MDVQSASLPGSRVKFRTTAKAKCCYNPAEQLNYLAQQERVRIDLRRTSLHGKPLLVRQCRTDVRYRRLQAQIYNFLERPKTWKSITYHVFVFACVFICLQLSVLSTLKDYEKMAGITLFYLEMAMLFWFFTEYCIRVWSAGCRSRYQTWRGRLRFMHRPFCLVDATVIIASVVVLSMGTDSQRFAASPLRGLRFFQILRMIRMDRRGGSWKLLASVVWAHRQELFTTVYIGFLVLISSSFVVYLLERDVNDKIKSYADALWWGVVTLCTVGYGDTVPKTWMGKLVAAFCAVAGISFFALPAGILGSGFALKVQQHQREKHLIRRRMPAATLIQCLWRCYAADVNSTSVATWKIHTRPTRSMASDSSEKSINRLTRFATTRRLGVCSVNTPIIAIQRDSSVSNRPTRSSSRTSVLSDAALTQRNSSSRFVSVSTLRRLSSLDLGKHIHACDQFTQSDGLTIKPQHQNSGWKFKFRSLAYAMRSHMNLSSLDSGNHTIAHLSNHVLDCDVEPTQYSTRTLTESEKAAIRAIRKIKYFVARRKFREALRPYDVKDVIEQYSAGHLDMLGRIKILQARLDQILGRPCDKDKHPVEVHVPLASRIVKIEHKLTSIEAKLNILVSLHTSSQYPLVGNSAISEGSPKCHRSPSDTRLQKTSKLMEPICENTGRSDVSKRLSNAGLHYSSLNTDITSGIMQTGSIQLVQGVTSRPDAIKPVEHPEHMKEIYGAHSRESVNKSIAGEIYSQSYINKETKDSVDLSCSTDVFLHDTEISSDSEGFTTHASQTSARVHFVLNSESSSEPRLTNVEELSP